MRFQNNVQFNKRVGYIKSSFKFKWACFYDVQQNYKKQVKRRNIKNAYFA